MLFGAVGWLPKILHLRGVSCILCQRGAPGARNWDFIMGREPNRKLRLLIIMGFLFIFVGVVIVRLAVLMVSSPPEDFSSDVAVERGSILDRNGRILAIQMSFDTVTAWIPDIEDPKAVSELLAPIIDRDTVELERDITSSNGFKVLKRQITLLERTEIRRLLNEGVLKGIALQKSTGRVYPERELAAPLIGYIGVDNTGLAGIEYSFDQQLLSSADSDRYGNHLFLTIDINLQYFVERVAARALHAESADRVMIVVMDPASGEVLALATQPSFDPNNFANYSEERRRNHAIATIYEPGSVFKIFSMAALLEYDAIRDTSLFDTSLGYSGENEYYQIRDVGAYGVLDVRGIIKFSSNIGAALASDRIGVQPFYLQLYKLGFGQRTGVALGGEERGIFRDWQQWTERTKPTIAIGQEIGVTALQMVTAASTIANRGVMVRPQVVKRIVSAGGQLLVEYKQHEERRLLSLQTADQVLQYMTTATEAGGTARRVVVEGINVAAKTGTAEVYDSEIQGYSPDHFIASTLAIFPTEEPQYIVYGVVDYPREDSTYGGRIVAPLVKEIIEYIISYSGIEDSQEAITYRRIDDDTPLALPQFSDYFPDLRGYPKRLLIPLLQHPTLRVEIEGYGRVVRQFPAPGSAIESNSVLFLELE